MVNITEQQQRNLYVLFLGIIAIGTAYTMYTNYHTNKTNRLTQEKLKKEGNGNED